MQRGVSILQMHASRMCETASCRTVSCPGWQQLLNSEGLKQLLVSFPLRVVM